MKAQSLSELYDQVSQLGNLSWEYWEKQIHQVPKTDSVDRVEYLMAFVKGKVALHIGCLGPLDDLLKKEAYKLYGIDKMISDRADYHAMDLDQCAYLDLPKWAGVEAIVCGEVVEHLSNPGFFLKKIKETYPRVPVCITVPNAYGVSQKQLLTRGIENVNNDHCFWFSYTTLKTLVEREGYEVKKFHWYGGKPCVSEGLIFVIQ